MPGVTGGHGLRRVVRVKISTGIERQPAAEDPGQDEDAADQPGNVMPGHPAAIGRNAAPRVAAAPSQPQDADPEAGHRHDDADARYPEHDQPPGGAVLAEDRGIDPVRDRAQPIPYPLAAR